MTTNFNFNHLAELVGNVVDQKIVSLRELFVQENAKLRQDLLEKMSQLEQTMNGKMDDLENKLNGKMDNLESTLNNQMNNLDATLNGRVDNLESTLNNKITSIQNQLTSKIDSSISDMNNKIIQATTSIIKFDNQITVPISRIARINFGFKIPTNSEKYFVFYNGSITIRSKRDGSTRTSQYSGAKICYKTDNYIQIYSTTSSPSWSDTSVSGQAQFFY